MRKKDFANTFNINKPQNFEQKVNKDIETYNSTKENGDIQQKNMEFTQMYNTYLPELTELAVDNGLARAILDIMACSMELNNTYIISQKDLAKVFDKDERTIRNAVKILKDRDFIRTFKFQRQNVYFINPRIFCKASAGYKQKLIQEYVKLDELKDYREQHQSVDMSVLKDTAERLVFKKSFAKEHHELERPNNMEIHKQNQVKEAISNLTDEQLNVILQLNVNKKTLSDKEIQKIQADNEQRIKAIHTSQEYLETLKQEQEIQDEIDSLERQKVISEQYKEIEERITTEFLMQDIDENDPFGIENFLQEEPDPLDYIIKD